MSIGIKPVIKYKRNVETLKWSLFGKNYVSQCRLYKIHFSMCPMKRQRDAHWFVRLQENYCLTLIDRETASIIRGTLPSQRKKKRITLDIWRFLNWETQWLLLFIDLWGGWQVLNSGQIGMSLVALLLFIEFKQNLYAVLHDKKWIWWRDCNFYEFIHYWCL